jgi:hypothetical protein
MSMFGVYSRNCGSPRLPKKAIALTRCHIVDS